MSITAEKRRSLKTVNKDISIFISYSWADVDFVNMLDDALQKYGYKVIRDIRDSEYSTSIREFMKNIRKTDYSVIILSDNFLKSENCMREIFEFIKDENFKDRIIAVMMESAKNIWEDNKGISYAVYWDKREKNFKENLKQIDDESKSGYIEDLKLISTIKDSIGEVVKIFKSMKMFYGSNKNIVSEINNYIEGRNRKKKVLIG